MTDIHYSVIYRNEERMPVKIGDFMANDGVYFFKYVENPRYEFPGFDKNQRTYTSDHLWEQISFRVPNNIRNQHPASAPEHLLKYTEGKLVTDHFEFQLVSE